MLKIHKIAIIAVIIVVIVISAALIAPLYLGQPSTTPESTTKEIVDMRGKTVTIPTNVTKVVVVFPMAFTAICAIDGGDKLVGIPNWATGDLFLMKFFPELKSLTLCGSPTSVNIETIVSTGAQIVINSNTATATNNAIEARGIPVIAVNFDNYTSFLQSVTIMGDAIDKSTQAKAFTDFYSTKIDTVYNQVSNISSSDQPKVLFLNERSGKISTLAGDFFTSVLINKAGGVNVAAELTGGWVTVSAEQIIDWNPDVILTCSSDSLTHAYTPELSVANILNNSQYQTINAVINKKVYETPSDGEDWWMAGKTAMFTEWLAIKLHPTRFTEFNLVNDADSFYNQFYGITYASVFGSAIIG